MEDVYYTILPPKQAVQEKCTASKLVKYRGVLLYAIPYDAEHYQIQQICSTDPADYLTPALQPGQLISLIEHVE
ncbi:MAG: hypothetical protein IKM15_03005 [Peptococcaceae bacterium]|nr:hypothetical protein [Peptococcaceae bacterium]